MQLFNIKTFFEFLKYLISLSSINMNELICLGNSKDLGMFTWCSDHVFPKMSLFVAVEILTALNPWVRNLHLFPFREQMHRTGVSLVIQTVHFHRGEGLGCAGTGKDERINDKLKGTEIRGAFMK